MRKLLAGISDYGRMHSLNQIRRDLTDCSHKMRRIDDAGWVSAFGKLVSETGQYFSPKVRRSALYSSDQFTIPIAACRADALHSHRTHSATSGWHLTRSFLRRAASLRAALVKNVNHVIMRLVELRLRKVREQMLVPAVAINNDDLLAAVAGHLVGGLLQ